MKNKILNNCENLIITLLTAVMVGIPLTHYICAVKALYYSYIATTIYVITVPCLVMTLFYRWNKRKSIRLGSYEKLFCVLIILLIIGCFTAQDRYNALFGAPGRNEGLFMLLCYYTLFYSARLIADEKKRTLLINIFLTVLTIHALYGIGQFYELDLSFIHDYYHYAISGVAGNPNFMGSLMVMASAVAIGMAVYSNKTVSRFIYSILSVVFITALIFTKTMSAYLGLAGILFTLFVFFTVHIYKAKGTKTVALFILFAVSAGLILLFIVDRLAYGIISAEIKIILNQIASGNIEDIASGRFFIWANIFKMLPEYILFGTGIDGLEAPYYERYGLFSGAFLDKAHNELIQILITMGIFVFVCYIIFYILIAKNLKKRVKSNKNNAVNMALLLVFVGYITQAMFNISVLDVAPYFWILLGLMAKPLTEK